MTREEAYKFHGVLKSICETPGYFGPYTIQLLEQIRKEVDNCIELDSAKPIITSWEVTKH